MPADELICPACSSRLKRPKTLRDGEPFECPMCATEFRAGANERGTTAARRPTQRKIEELEVIDESAADELEVLAEEKIRGPRKRRKRRPSAVVEVGHWLRIALEHWMPMLPPAVGFFFLFLLADILVGLVIGVLGGLLARALPIVGGFITLFIYLSIMVPLSGGMTLVSVQQLIGRRWSFNEFFSGSQWWLSLVLNYILLQVFYAFVIFAPSLLLIFAIGTIVHPVAGMLLGYGLGVLIYVALYPLTWMFSWQLIVDGNYGPVEAITENFQMALPNYFKLLPLAALTLFIRVLGILFLGIGYAAAWPLAVLIESTAYLRLTGRRVVEKGSEMR
jgi:hypothetical protein